MRLFNPAVFGSPTFNVGTIAAAVPGRSKARLTVAAVAPRITVSAPRPR